MTNKRILTLITLLLFLLLVVGCDWLTQNQPPVITTTTLPVATVGTAYSATIVATDADEEDVLTYTVSGPTGIVISSEGLLGGWTPAIAGTVAITVAVSDGKDSVSADFTIMVNEPEPEPEIELTGIEVDPKTMTLFVGEKDFFKVTANYSDDTTKNVTNDCVYVSNDPTIAKVLLVSPSNLQKSVEAVREGVAKITVSYTEGAVTKIDEIIVKVNPVLLTSIVVEPNTMDLLVGESKTIDSVTAHYNDESTEVIVLEDCTYTSLTLTPTKVVTVNNGVITAVEEGTSAVSVGYTEDDITVKDEIIVTVNPIPPGELAARDFYYSDYYHPCGWFTGYQIDCYLTDATFEGVQSVVMKLYSGDTLLQTNTATAKVGIEVTGSVITSPFDISVTFDYVCDGYWINVRESEYGEKSIPTKVVATVILANGKVLTAENTSPIGF